jgi:orotidine-5'-phosphate decarboxylase
MDDGNTIYEIMGGFVDSWGADDIGESGYSFVGAVVGATYPEQAKKLRELMPNTIFLVPGYGAQGGGAEDVRACSNEDGMGAIINSSRGVIFAYEKNDSFDEKTYAEAARAAVLAMKEDLANI